MKIRLKSNTIRYRLDKNDINSIIKSNHTKEETCIATGKIHFCIKGRIINNPEIKLDPFSVHLLYPKEQLLEWASSTVNGLYFSLINNDGSILQLTIEKDYKCLTPRDEDESTAFSNPMSAHNC